MITIQVPDFEAIDFRIKMLEAQKKAVNEEGICPKKLEKRVKMYNLLHTEIERDSKTLLQYVEDAGFMSPIVRARLDAIIGTL